MRLPWQKQQYSSQRRTATHYNGSTQPSGKTTGGRVFVESTCSLYGGIADRAAEKYLSVCRWIKPPAQRVLVYIAITTTIAVYADEAVHAKPDGSIGPGTVATRLQHFRSSDIVEWHCSAVL
jgi:hypothetical protein